MFQNMIINGSIKFDRDIKEMDWICVESILCRVNEEDITFQIEDFQGKIRDTFPAIIDFTSKAVMEDDLFEDEEDVDLFNISEIKDIYVNTSNYNLGDPEMKELVSLEIMADEEEVEVSDELIHSFNERFL